MATRGNILGLGVIMCLMTSFRIAYGEDMDIEVDSVVGNMAKIPCDVDISGNVKFVYWRKSDGTQLYTFDSRKVPLSKGTHYPKDQRFSFMSLERPSYLLLKKARPDDEGLYECSVLVKGKRAKTYVTYLRVIVPPTKIRIFDTEGREDPTTPYHENATAVFTCEVIGGKPPPLISWWKGPDLLDNEIDSSEADVHQNALRIGPLTRDDQGKSIVCQALNSNLTNPISKSIELDVNYAPLTVNITTPETPLNAGQEYPLTCISNGARPPAIITWWIGDERLTETKDYTTNSGNTTLSTVFFTPGDEDGGKVLECHSQSQVIPHDALIALRTLQIFYAPKVVLSMTPETAVNEGDDVSLSCDVTSNPEPSNITWFHERQELHEDKEKRIKMEGNMLLLQSVTRHQSGLYSCVAANEVGHGTSEGFVLPIQYVPVCNKEEEQIVGSSLSETISVPCKLLAAPEVTSFRWQFNNSDEVLDMAEDKFRSEDDNSVLVYTTNIKKDFGTLMCWGTNALGEQAAPCLFRLVEAGLPDKPENCTFVKNYTSSSVFVECVEGNDGGLPQSFVGLLFDMQKKVYAKNVSVAEPFFAYDDLPPATDFLLTINSVNAKGPSEKQVLQVYTAVPVVAYPNNPRYPFPITPVLGVLIGLVGALVVVAVIMALLMRLRSDPAEKKPPKEMRRGRRAPVDPREGGEPAEGVNSRADDDYAGEGIPSKLKHVNLYETVSYESNEGGRTAEMQSDKTSDNDADSVEYAELTFSNCKKKSKAKKSNPEKKSSKISGNHPPPYDPTLYASIDHVQTEKQKLATMETDPAQLNNNNGQLHKQMTSPTPPSPPPPLHEDFLQPPNQSKNKSAKPKPVKAQAPQQPPGPQNPEDRKWPGRPTNLDRPALAKKPSLPVDPLNQKRSIETQTPAAAAAARSILSSAAPSEGKEDTPLIETSVESCL